MIGFLKGKVLTNDQPLVVDVNGVGYEVFVPERILPEIRVDQNMSLFIYTNVKQDGIELFGFETMGEKSLYKLLIDVDGIGPKLGLSILGQIEPQKLLDILVTDKILPKFKGAGTKVSERLDRELRIKVKKTQGLKFSAADNSQNYNQVRELRQALMGLGYSESELNPILSQLNLAETLPKLLKQALSLLKSEKLSSRENQ